LGGVQRKLRAYLEKITLDFSEKKKIRCNLDVENNMERTLDMVEVLCACLIEWHTAFGRVNWTKLSRS